jgi:hypothetical protein
MALDSEIYLLEDERKLLLKKLEYLNFTIDAKYLIKSDLKDNF